MKLTWKSTSLLAILALIPLTTMAAEAPPEGRGKPPAEAMAACKGRKAGEEVTFSLRNGDKVSGICREVRGELVAVPDRGGQGGGKRDGAPAAMGKRDGGPMERLSEQLGLSEEQQNKIRAILAEEEKNNEPLRSARAEGRDKLRKLAEGERFDEAAIRAVAAAQEKNRTELLVSYLRVWHDVRALLTPEQRLKAKEVAPLFERRIMGDMGKENEGPRPE